MQPILFGRQSRFFAMVGIGILMMTACERYLDDGVSFAAQAPPQTSSVTDFSSLRFSDQDGQPVALTDAFETDYLVLVITRGFNNAICLYCSSQTSKWARRYDDLAPYDADLAVIFPTIDAMQSVRVRDLENKILGGDIPNESIPYPILLDFDLQSVDQLGLRAELAKPATYILDRSGAVRYAYVGQSIADRPSVDAILQQLERLRTQDSGSAGQGIDRQPIQDRPRFADANQE